MCCNCVRISQLYSRRVCTVEAENGSLGIVWFLTLLPKIVKIDPRYDSTAPILTDILC